MKDFLAENVKRKLELRNLIHFPWKAGENGAECVPPQYWKRKS